MKINKIIFMAALLTFVGVGSALCQIVPKTQPAPSETKPSNGKQNQQSKPKAKRSKTQILVGSWKDENSEFVLNSNKELEIYFDTGAETYGTWEVKGNVLYEYCYNDDTKEWTLYTYDILVLKNNYFQYKSRDDGTVWSATRTE